MSIFHRSIGAIAVLLLFVVMIAAQVPSKEAPYSAELVVRLIAEAKTHGDARRGAEVFRAAQFACISCHLVGKQGGTVGPELTLLSRCLTPEQIVESVLWPKKQVKDEFIAISVTTADGKTVQGYKEREDGKELVLRDPATRALVTIKKSHIDERTVVGTLMPDGLAQAMTPAQRRDLVRFLMDLGKEGASSETLLAHGHAAVKFPYVREPLRPELWPSWRHPVNRDRVYDFYARQAEYFIKQPTLPLLLSEFPGLDGEKHGHWGNQNEAYWRDDRWNNTDLGTVLGGVFRGQGMTVPRGVCVRLGDKQELSACFNPDTLSYEALWQGRFVKFSPVRHGFLDGLIMDGTPLPRPEGKKPALPFKYHGYYRHGKRIIFSYRIGEVDMLDAPWCVNGKFIRQVAPVSEHPLRDFIRGGPVQWPKALATRGTLGKGGPHVPYVVDTMAPPFDNPWKAPLFFGGLDFLADGAALLCTIQGDVWRVDGLDDRLDNVRWRRIASGLHQPLGLVVAGKDVYVQGRDQITRLHDLNGDGETDFYECISNAFETSPAGHDFICGLERDTAGNFYTASGNQGVLRISSDGKRVEVLATGLRNPDGLGLFPDGSITVPCSEGEWTPSSMLCLIRPGTNKPFLGKIGGTEPAFFGYRGPRNGKAPDLPFVYLPRGLDNSSGGQLHVSSDRWGPLSGQMIHLSYGACSYFVVLRDEGQAENVGGPACLPQGAVVPLPGEFLSGAHRGRFHPKDGQLYVVGMAGWGTYAVADGCFQRVRYTGQPAQLPIGFQMRQNGVLVRFARPIDARIAGQVKSQFAQAWNYRYSTGYGSPEFSPRHPGTPGHDPWPITKAHVLPDGKSLFLEILDLQPVNQLHLHLRVDSGPAHDVYATVHALGEPFRDYPGYRPVEKIVAAHPILADLSRQTKAVPNPWRNKLPGARAITIQADKNLTYATKTLTVRAGETLRLTLANPDVVPHNWVLIKQGSLPRFGEQVNRIVADPDAVVRQYVPKSTDALAWTDIVQPHERSTIYFHAPKEKGRYPYLCTFPGHWMVMNGVMVVE